MKYEKSCGAVIYRTLQNKREYLLIFNKKGDAPGHWGFAKGHMEAGEEELDTVHREIAEETGLTVTVEPFFRQISHYSPKPDVEKDSIYYAAIAATDAAVTIQESELGDYAWLTLDDALARLTYPADAEILAQADKFLSMWQNITAVIFDMDGVIIDSETVHYASLSKTLAAYGKSVSYDYYSQFVGSTNQYMWRTLIDDLGLPDKPDELMRTTFAYTDAAIADTGYPPVDGAAELITELAARGMSVAVASSSPLSSIEETVDRLKIRDCFTALVSGEEVAHPKPAPDTFLKAARELCENPANCLVIEDSYNGVTAAKAAGMSCVGLRNPSSGKQDISAADYIVNVGFYSGV